MWTESKNMYKIIQVKIEAMYRNELLDDILNIMKIM